MVGLRGVLGYVLWWRSAAAAAGQPTKGVAGPGEGPHAPLCRAGSPTLTKDNSPAHRTQVLGLLKRKARGLRFQNKGAWLYAVQLGPQYDMGAAHVVRVV
jgi:hypothetical protein